MSLKNFYIKKELITFFLNSLSYSMVKGLQVIIKGGNTYISYEKIIKNEQPEIEELRERVRKLETIIKAVNSPSSPFTPYSLESESDIIDHLP